ncbi:MAG: hypothetical protein ACYTG1_02290 [Planctomycetota bacterium]
MVRIQTFGSRQRERGLRGYRWAASQPSWIVRVALVTFVAIVAIPFAVLLLLALLLAVVVFGGLALVNLGMERVRALVRGPDRSSNVRIVRRDDPGQ